MPHQPHNPDEKEILQQTIEIEDPSKKLLSQISFYFVLWGIIVTLGSLIHYVLLRWSDYDQPYLAWLIIIPGIIIAAIYGYRSGKDLITTASQPQERHLTGIWTSFLISYVILNLFAETLNLIPVILLLAGQATFLSGVIIRFSLIQAGGFVWWIFSIPCFFLPLETQLLFSTIAAFAGFVIPGYLLRKKT